MSSDNPEIREVSEQNSRIIYSFCTLVTNISEYIEMTVAFQKFGFAADDCEFLYIDNSKENRFDAFSGYNRFLQLARGKYVILCHQDVLPIEDDQKHLDQLLVELTARDSHWGLCGNAGALDRNRVAYKISDPFLKSTSEGGPFPVRVMSLDENFIVVRRDANLAASHDLLGFHWYGSDLCLIADVLGWNAYIIDFHLNHKSGGFQDKTYRQIRKQLALKYRRAFRTRWYYAIGTQTHRPTLISGSITDAINVFTIRFPFKELILLTAKSIRRKLMRKFSL